MIFFLAVASVCAAVVARRLYSDAHESNRSNIEALIISYRRPLH